MLSGETGGLVPLRQEDLLREVTQRGAQLVMERREGHCKQKETCEQRCRGRKLKDAFGEQQRAQCGLWGGQGGLW